MDPLRVFYIFLIIIAIATYIYGEAMGYFRSHHYYECERITEKNLFYVNTKEQYLIHITNDENKKFRMIDTSPIEDVYEILFQDENSLKQRKQQIIHNKEENVFKRELGPRIATFSKCKISKQYLQKRL
tara:strand:- start:3153 stop:3539 length:387 start_codon:yes stop_codon:yes gene_type:complete